MSAALANRPLPSGGPTAGGDEFDDLDNYDFDGPDDPFSENYKSKTTVKDTTKDKTDDDLGLKEVEVTKKIRAPRVKLDEHRQVSPLSMLLVLLVLILQRLLSAAGIPKLRKKAKDHLKFKGKGHEVSITPPRPYFIFR